ncbi:MAG: DNA polymerase III subunit delta' [Oscillibacter sp.]|nr:DNA polymerase III subunit delta' [Oscillibacter sp.]
MDAFHGALADRIRASADRGALSHALLFSGDGDLLAAARFAAAAMECTAERGKPCGVCPACRKVFGGIHPDVITVVDPDPKHKYVSVDVIRQTRADVFTMPNEGARKVYIFPDCGIVTEQDQNVLLKIVEEGPAYAAFLFCAENPSVVLQTLRSRCVECNVAAATAEARTEEALYGAELCRAIAQRRRGAAAEFAVRMEKKKLSREELIALLDEAYAVAADALEASYGKSGRGARAETAALLGKNLTNKQIMKTIELLHRYRAECAYNVGAAHVLGALAVGLEGIL